MITSFDNPKIKYLQKLSQAKYRKQERCFVVEGSHLVEEARKKGVLIEAFSLALQEGYIQCSEPIMKKIANTDTVVSEIGLCQMLSSNSLTDRILILDCVQDPGNMGALLRSACAFGFQTIFISDGSCDLYNPKVIRASQGAIFKLHFWFGDPVAFIKNLTNYDVYGTDVQQGVDVQSISKSSHIALILGNEGNGISKEIQSLQLKNLYIPMENTESLNVSVAGSILMYELKK